MSEPAILDRTVIQAFRVEAGAGYARLLGYFRDDGVKSVTELEEALRRGDAEALVLPARMLKGDALQFGARPLADLAEHIEQTARICAERKASPDGLVPHVWRLRALFDETVAALAYELGSPAAPARPVPARRCAGAAAR